MDNYRLSAFDGTTQPLEPRAETSIDKKRVDEALAILQKYRNAKTNLEHRIVDEHTWWRRRHWKELGTEEHRSIPAGAQLFNSIENKIADIYDNIPDCSFLARSEDDEKTAETLTSVMPAILEEADIENAYCAVARDKVTTGTGVYCVTWNPSKRNGVGDIDIASANVLNLYWESGVEDIQDSPNLFYVANVSNEKLLSAYPQLKGKLGGDSTVVTEYVYEDSVDKTDKTSVVDWYYKKDGAVHYCKICAGEVLYASEDDENYRDGFYAHGMYPFVFDVMFPLPGTPCGFGYISVGKDQQMQIDRLNNAIVRNSIQAASPKQVIKESSGINPEDLMNVDREVVPYKGSGAINEVVMTLDRPQLNANYLNVFGQLEADLKETTANRDFANGGTAGGVTSGTAITALVESGNKQSRTLIRVSYDAYKKVVSMCLELVRQFYDYTRVYRIQGDDGNTEYVPFDNSAMQGVPNVIGGEDFGTKEPIFDIKIRAHKQSPFARVTQNEMMKEFFGMGFFAPENATVALACLEGMEFEGKDALKRRIEQNGTIQQENIMLKEEMLKMAAIIDGLQKNSHLTEQMASEFGVETPAPQSVSMPRQSVQESPDVMRSQSDPRLQKQAEKIAQTTEVQ